MSNFPKPNYTCDEKFFSVEEFEKKAKEIIDKKFIKDYIFGGANFNEGVVRNREAMKKILLKPRVCSGLGKSIDLSTTILGHKVSMPIGFSPTMCRAWTRPDGELCAAMIASEENLAFGMSSFTETPIDKVSSCMDEEVLKLFGISPLIEDEMNQEMIDLCEEAGFHGLIVTVDHPVHGKRKFDSDGTTDNSGLLKKIGMPNLPKKLFQTFVDHATTSDLDMFESSETWADIKHLKSMTSNLKIIVKGVLRAEDALEAINAGVDAIWVSNHGGRQLGDCPATIDILKEVAEVVKQSENKDVELFVDGGFRTGGDVLKALAIGANCVFVGRPVLSGIAVNGEDGVRDVVNILKKELKISMALCGCKCVDDINPNVIW